MSVGIDHFLYSAKIFKKIEILFYCTYVIERVFITVIDTFSTISRLLCILIFSQYDNTHTVFDYINVLINEGIKPCFYTLLVD